MTNVMIKIINEELIAFFPELCGDRSPSTMLCYAHIGQHSAAHESYAAEGKLASHNEAKPLLKELQNLGYEDLNVVSRFKREDYWTRWLQLRASAKSQSA